MKRIGRRRAGYATTDIVCEGAVVVHGVNPTLRVGAREIENVSLPGYLLPPPCRRELGRGRSTGPIWKYGAPLVRLRRLQSSPYSVESVPGLW